MKRSILVISILIIPLSVLGCQPGQTFGPTATPSLSPTNIPTSTPTITPTNTPLPITNTPSLPGTVTGLVMNSSNLPLENVGIKLLKNLNLVTETKTNSEGKFTFENIPPGKYVIKYDYFPEGGFAIHYFGEEIIVESESTTRQEYVIKN